MKKLLVAVVVLGLAVSGFAQWSQNTTGTGANLNDVLFSDAQNGIIVGNGGYIFQSADGGQSWVEVSNPAKDADNSIVGLDMLDGQSGMGACNGGIIITTSDGGGTWTEIATGSDNDLIDVAVVDAQVAYAAGGSGTILKTTDGGATWTPQESKINGDVRTISFYDADYGIAGGKNAYVSITSDGGANWDTVQVADYSESTFRGIHLFDAQNAIAVGDGGIMKTMDSGATWERVDEPSGKKLTNIYFHDALNGVIVGQNGTVLTTTDGGATWVDEDDGDTGTKFQNAYMFDATTIIVVGKGDVILQKGTPMSAVAENSTNAPARFELGQNYPNPFNPTTTIPFSLEQAGTVSLKIYDVTGRQVTELINENFAAGSHLVQFDASELGSGIYIYQIQSGKSIAQKKLLLVK